MNSLIDRVVALCEKDSETYRIPLPTGDEVEFRHVKGPDEITKLEMGAAQLIAMVKERTAPKEILGAGVKDPVTLTQAHFLKSLYVKSWRIDRDAEGAEPKFEEEPDAPTLTDWLTMAAKAPFIFRTLWARVDSEVTGEAATMRRQMIESAKKGSSETQSGSPSSDAAGKLGTDTPES